MHRHLMFLALLMSVYSQSTPPGSIDYSCLHAMTQQVNCDANLNPYYRVMTDVYTGQFTSQNPSYFTENAYLYSAYDVPYYNHTVTKCDIDSLESRPYRMFEEGPLVIDIGMKVNWADNVGYQCTIPTGVPGQNTCYCVSESYDDICPGVCSLAPCTEQEFVNGDNLIVCQYGYWPPGPLCPSPQTPTVLGNYGISLYPYKNNYTAGPLGCYLSLGPQGYFVNGVPIYNWHDGKSFNDTNIWHNSAYYFEYYDFDLCSGHAESTGQYHHHIYPNCLAEQLGDTGMEHSPVYGFAIDGFPLYGPWHAENQLSESCYVERNYYGTPDVQGGWGCGANGNRTCVLDDIMNPTSLSFLLANEYGPTVHEVVYSQSGAAINAISGTYYEDYYYNETCDILRPTHPYLLDRNNGHDHDNLGYHYHATVDANGTAVFPYLVGPQFYGVLPLSYENNCCNSITTATAGATCLTTSVPSASNFNIQVGDTSTSPATNVSTCTSFDDFTCSSDKSAQYLSFCASDSNIAPTRHHDPSLANGLETSVQVMAFISFTFSALVVITGILFPYNFSFSCPFNNILLMISISAMIGSLSMGFQFPHNGTSLCTAQAVLYLYFTPACIVWTTLLVYQLRSMLINGKIKISMRATHIIGWSLPLIPLFLPLTDDNVAYGIDDQLSGEAPCSFRGKALDEYVWFNVIFTIPILSCFILMVAWYIETYFYFKHKGLFLFQKQNRELLTIALYPIILLITWLPNIVYFMIQLFRGDSNQRESPDFITTSFLISTQYGTMLAILFFIQSGRAREKWSNLYYRGQCFIERQASGRSTRGSVTFNDVMHAGGGRKSELTTESEIVL